MAALAIKEIVEYLRHNKQQMAASVVLRIAAKYHLNESEHDSGNTDQSKSIVSAG